jgi:hypothetical protein
MAKPRSNIAAAADAIAVPPMPVKWTDLISDENIAGILTTQTPRHKVFCNSSTGSAGRKQRRFRKKNEPCAPDLCAVEYN